jgi:diacylglycerol kinase
VSGVKEFVIYTALRVALFVAVLAIVLAVWIKVLGHDANAIWPLVIAFLISGVLSIFLLNRPREAFARRVERRAARAVEKFDDLKRQED